jgi:hypothetical protein
LRVLADTAASPGSHQAFYDLGSVTDRAGHKAVAIAYEKQENQTSPLGTSCTTRVSSSGSTVTCTVSGPASGSASGKPIGTSSGPGVSVVTEGGSAGHLPADFMQSSLVVLVFDPDTGAFLGEEYAYCDAPVGAHLATGKCFATSYDQFLEIKAVQSIPAKPAGPEPTDMPGSGSPSTLPTNTDLPTSTPSTPPTSTP